MNTRWPDGFFHPDSEDALAELIRLAQQRGRPVRVRGAAHSEVRAIYSDAYLAGQPEGAIEIMLDRLRGFSIDREAKRVTVQAGCNFGFDPRDPTGRSTETNGLCPALDGQGLALPLLGGVTHQTIAGFLATGSEGGSLRHSVPEQVAALTLIDGRGEIHRLERGTDLFEAAGVSLGTFGIVSSVTLDCVDRFDLEGEERVSRIADAEFDLFSPGDDGLAAFLQREPYARVLWWPQPGVHKLVVWKARPATTPRAVQPYEAFPTVAGSRKPMQLAAGLALRSIGTRPRAVYGSLMRVRRGVEGALRRAYDTFVPEGEPQTFFDAWHRAIPLDDQMDERFMPVRFTEIWVDINHAAELMCRLEDLFAKRGYEASANFVFEIYGGKRSQFWMSPGFERDSVRLNVFWLRHNRGDPEREFFPFFWELTRDLGARLHWGKILDPRDDGLLARYPKHEAFLDLRAELDPDELFLSDYWRRHLGVKSVPLRPLSTEPEAPTRPLFSLRPTEPDFGASARAQFSVSFRTSAPPEQVFESFRVDPRAWVKEMRDYRPLTGPARGVGTVVDEVFPFMTVRVRVVDEEPGRRWTASVDACSLPLAERMLQDVRFETIDGETQATWTIYYDPLPQVAKLEPLVRPLFRGLFSRMATEFKAHLDQEAAC